MTSSQNSKLIAVVGPTGSGKTALAVALAKKFNGVLISADSRQVYQGLDIGTNKEGVPGQWAGQPARLISKIPQLLVDITPPGQRFTLDDWLNRARALLTKIWSNNQLPIIVGGTGLYTTALQEGYQPGAGRFAKRSQPVNFTALLLQVNIDRSMLNQRSDQRFVKIFEALITETQGLIEGGVPSDWLNQIGLDYRYAFKHISGALTQAEATSQYQQAARQYIRRQLTWWRHHGRPVLIQTSDEANKQVQAFLET